MVRLILNIFKDSDRPVGFALASTLAAGLAVLTFIFAFVLHEAAPLLFNTDKLIPFLFTNDWRPLGSPPEFGILYAWVSTLLVTLISLGLAIPVGFCVGIFLSEVAPAFIRDMIQPCLDVLSGIPSVIYGFLGYVTIIPLLERKFEMAVGDCILAAGLVLAVMILPFLASVSFGAFRSVPDELRESSLSMGITRLYMVKNVIMPKALLGLFAAVILGFTRAIGETMAVLMLVGNSLIIPVSPLDRGQPLTALIATELGEAGVGSEKYFALFSAGAVLMLVVVFINAMIWKLKKRLVVRNA